MAEKISVDVDKLYEEKAKQNRPANGNGARKYSLDELMGYDAEQTLLEKMRNRGQMSMMDVYLLNKMERDERRDQQPYNIDDIIKKSQEPLLKQIEDMKREREREEQERKFDSLRGEITDLKSLLLNGSGKRDDDNPVVKKLEALEQELKAEKEKAAKKDMDDFKSSISDALDSISGEIYNIRSKGTEKSKSDLERLEELINMQERYKKVLGINGNSKDEDASTADLLSTGIDMFNEKVPGLVKTVGTLRDGFKGGTDLSDDVPMMESLPTQLPSRTPPQGNRSSIPDDIVEFLDNGHDTEQGFVDVSGIPWQDSITGKPVMRKDIETQAILHPENVRGLIEEAYNAVPVKPKENKPKSPNPVMEDEESDQLQDDVPLEAEPKENVSDNKDVEQNTQVVQEPPKNKSKTAQSTLDKAMKYIDSGTDEEDEHGKIVWVGNKNEIYNGDKGTATREELIAEAKADPVAFMNTVNAHLKSLDEDNGN